MEQLIGLLQYWIKSPSLMTDSDHNSISGKAGDKEITLKLESTSSILAPKTDIMVVINGMVCGGMGSDFMKDHEREEFATLWNKAQDLQYRNRSAVQDHLREWFWGNSEF